MSAIESAQRANTIVYSILFKDDDAYGNGGGFGRTGISIPGMGGPGMGRGGGRPGEVGADTRKSMPTARKFWSESPAKPVDACFEVSKKEPVEQIYSQIEEELRNQYNLGYTPDRENAADVRISQDSGNREEERSGRAGERRILRREVSIGSRRWSLVVGCLAAGGVGCARVTATIAAGYCDQEAISRKERK